MRTKPCIVLAWLADAKYTEEEIFLEKGDVLFLYTDGVTEAMNNDKDLFSEQRLVDAINKNTDASVVELLPAIKREIDTFAEGAEQADDITMLALRINDQENKPIGELESCDPEDKSKELNIEAKVENLDKVMAFINEKLENINYPVDLLNEILIASEEIFVNIASYSYAPATGSARIYISTDDKTVIEFEDSGKPYNPLEQPDPPLDKNPSDRPIGGLGVFLVKRIMDTVEYTRTESKNILKITKSKPSDIGQ